MAGFWRWKAKGKRGIEQLSLMCQEYSNEEKVLVKTFTGTLSKRSEWVTAENETHKLIVFSCFPAGSPYYDNVRPLSYPDSDAVLICFDISRPETLDSVLKKASVKKCLRRELLISSWSLTLWRVVMFPMLGTSVCFCFIMEWRPDCALHCWNLKSLIWKG